MSPVARDLLELPVDRGVAQIAQGFLDAAAAALDRLGKPREPEALHDFRVAIRRTRSLLRAYRPWLGNAAGRKIRARLRDLARSTNAGRDAEVQIAWLESHRSALRRGERAGLNWLLRGLRQTKRASYQDARRSARSPFVRIERALRSRLAGEAPSDQPRFRIAFGGLLESHAADLAKRLARIRAAADAAACHAARIAAKRLRYLLEPAAAALPDGKAAVKRLRSLQDLLGELNDLHLLADSVETGLKRVSSQKTKRMHQLALEGREPELARERRRDERLGLVRLAQIVRARRDELFRGLEDEWLGGPAKTFSERLQHVGAGLAAEDADREIERKYLLTGLPDRLREASSVEITQGWLPGTRLRERLRRVRGNGTDGFYRTLKVGSGLVRTEIEEETTAELFETMWPLTDGCRICKRRYRVPAGALVWEIDDFADRDLVLAEVELPAPDTPVEIPDWLAGHIVREVTGEKAYLNLHLAR